MKPGHRQAWPKPCLETDRQHSKVLGEWQSQAQCRQPQNILGRISELQLDSQVDQEHRALWHPGAVGLLLAHHHHIQLRQVHQEPDWLCDLRNTTASQVCKKIYITMWN